jgi:hypothetical protein
MDKSTKIFIFIIIFVIITYLLFLPNGTPMNEIQDEHYTSVEKVGYSPSFDIDPRDHPYSKDIAFRPDANGKMNVMNDIVSPFQMYDHTSMQEQYVDNNKNQLEKIEEREKAKKVRFSDEIYSKKPCVRTYERESTYDDSNINGYQGYETNNIFQYCVENKDAWHKNIVPKMLHNDIKITEEIDKDYGVLILHDYDRTFEKVFDVKKDIDTEDKLKNVINDEWIASMDSINGDYIRLNKK